MKTFSRLLATTATAVLISGCALDRDYRPVVSNDLGGASIAEEFAAAQGEHLGDEHIQDGLEALESGGLLDAQDAFNAALKLDPKNPSLHFLNGLTYHLRASGGDTGQLEYAKIGYQLALRYDSGNHWAAYQLGHINFGEQHFREAQDAFAYALSYKPDDAGLWKALAAASYYAQDLDTAERAISQAEKLAPDDPYILRNASLINGAIGQFDVASEYLEKYRNSDDRYLAARSTRLSNRLMDWKRYHKNASYQVAQSTSDILGSDTSSGLSADKDSKSSKKDKDADKPIPTRMTLVDVVIIRSEERHATVKGINLLSGLTAAIGGTTLSFNDTQTEGTSTVDTENYTWAQTLTISATNYTLNIFNDNTDHNEILARPTLIALDGKTSDFFSGSVTHVQIAGAAGS